MKKIMIFQTKVNVLRNFWKSTMLNQMDKQLRQRLHTVESFNPSVSNKLYSNLSLSKNYDIFFLPACVILASVKTRYFSNC